MFGQQFIQYGEHGLELGMRKQSGEVFLESLIGVLLTAWLGAGMAFCASQIMAAKADTKIINAAVLEMRQVLRVKGDSVCGTTPTISVLGKNITLSVNCQAQNTLSVSSSGGSITVAAPQKVELSASAKSLGLRDGDDVVVGSGERL